MKDKDKRNEQRSPNEAVVTLNQEFSLFDPGRTAQVTGEHKTSPLEYYSSMLLKLPNGKLIPLSLELNLPTNIHDEPKEEIESHLLTLLNEHDATSNDMAIEIFSKNTNLQRSRRHLISGQRQFSAPVYAALQGLILNVSFPENAIKTSTGAVIEDFNSLNFSLLVPILGISARAGHGYIYNPSDNLKIAGIRGEFVQKAV
jgi:hypothetical protein